MRRKAQGHLRVPSSDELRQYAARDYIDLSPHEAETIASCVAQYIQALDEVEELPELTTQFKYPSRHPGHVPLPNEDPLNAFTRLCRVEGANSGPLYGKKLGIKDNMAVAGVPITNGWRTLSYVPLGDAVVVERVLDAGAVIVGKLNLDAFSMSGFGETSYFGPIRNPHRVTHTAGGSSGGAAAALASGSIDLALGVDQGGSARIPASMCGCVAIKPTHGLVPSFGVEYVDPTLDSVCPMAMDVSSAAVLLGVIAGGDWRGPQHLRGAVEHETYVPPAKASVEGVKIGILTEAMTADKVDEEVLKSIGDVGRMLSDAGAEVDEVSLPIWRYAPSIATGVVLSRMPAMIRSDGMGHGHLGYTDVERVHATGLWRRQEANFLPPILKALLVANSFVESQYFNVVFAKAHNQQLVLKQAIDEIFSTYQILVTPTTPHTAAPLPPGKADQAESIMRAFSQSPFTAPLNISGHPALAMPCGKTSQGLPISVQLIAAHFDEEMLIRVASALETMLGSLDSPVSAVELADVSDATPQDRGQHER